MPGINRERRPAGLVRRYFVACAVLLGSGHAAPARGDVKPLPTAAPPSQPSPTAPTLATPSMTFTFVRSTLDTKGTTPILSVAAAPGAKISVTPASISGPGDLADITLKSDFFGKTFTYNFTNVPLDKDNNFTIDPSNAALAAQLNPPNGLYGSALNAILAKLPVNADPRTPITWVSPVQVQLTRIFPDGTTAAAVTSAKAADDAAQAAVAALKKSSDDADADIAAANAAVAAAAAKGPAEQAAAKAALDKANELKAGIAAATPFVNKAQTDTAAALTKAKAADQAGNPTPFAAAPTPDSRKKDKPQTATTGLSFVFQE